MQGPKDHKCVRDDKASQIAASKDCLEDAIDFTNDMIFYKFLISNNRFLNSQLLTIYI